MCLSIRDVFKFCEQLRVIYSTSIHASIQATTHATTGTIRAAIRGLTGNIHEGLESHRAIPCPAATVYVGRNGVVYPLAYSA